MLKTEFAGRKGPIFRLALKTGVLTVVTLGFYRFWMKTRLRRYYWSAIRPGGVPLEYVGQPLEKLLGFLVAVVFMAFYIGIVNLVLMYFSFALFQGNFVAYALSFAGVLPIVFFAQYRARRYILARTRWRGIRFGLEPGAWGYAWRVALHWLITLASLGILWPRMSFRLEKYRADRSYYGTQRVHQGGRWTMLLEPMRHLYYAAGLSLVAGGMSWVSENPAWLALLVLTGPWAVYGLAYWRAGSFRRLTNAKTVGDVGFRANPRAGRVLGIYIGGYALTYVSIVGALFAALLIVGFLAAIGLSISPEALLEGDFDAVPGWAATLAFVLAYFMAFILWGVFTHTFVTLPLAQHFAESTRIVNARALSGIGQRDRDEFAEAEGFADALDVGAAI